MDELLKKAVINGNIEVIKFLLENGAYINKKDNLGKIPLHYACENYVDSISTIKCLVEYGSNVNEKDIYDQKPFDTIIYEREDDNSSTNQEIFDYIHEIFWYRR